MASSHDTIVSSISPGSDETSLKKKRQEPQLGEEETGTSTFISPWFFCRPPSDSAVSCSRKEAPQNCLSIARFNEELMGLQVQASEEELEDSASSKLQPDRPIGTDCRQKRLVVDILAGLVPHSEVGENSPGMPLHLSEEISREWFFSNLSDLATVCSSSKWGPEKCQSTVRPNGEPEPQPKPPRRISESPSAHNLKPHVSAVRRWPSGCGRVAPPSRSADRVPLDVRQWVPGSSNFPPPKRRHVSAVRRYPPGCGRFPPSPPPTPSHESKPRPNTPLTSDC